MEKFETSVSPQHFYKPFPQSTILSDVAANPENINTCRTLEQGNESNFQMFYLNSYQFIGYVLLGRPISSRCGLVVVPVLRMV